MRILVAGASGLLGSNLMPFLEKAGHEPLALSRSGKNGGICCDISDRASAFRALSLANPDAIIDLVALPDVDRCESDPETARKESVSSAENIADWINEQAPERRPQALYVSTDQVYDAPGPSREDAVRIVNNYARFKLQA